MRSRVPRNSGCGSCPRPTSKDSCRVCDSAWAPRWSAAIRWRPPRKNSSNSNGAVRQFARCPLEIGAVGAVENDALSLAGLPIVALDRTQVHGVVVLLQQTGHQGIPLTVGDQRLPALYGGLPMHRRQAVEMAAQLLRTALVVAVLVAQQADALRHRQIQVDAVGPSHRIEQRSGQLAGSDAATFRLDEH